MNNKMFTSLFLILAVCCIFLTGCDDSGDSSASLSIEIKNQTFANLKKIYWQSNKGAGVIDIDVPGNTETTMTNKILPGTEFQFKITTSDPDEYVLWENIETDNNSQYLIQLIFTTVILDACPVLFHFSSGGSGSVTGVNSTENTLPST